MRESVAKRRQIQSSSLPLLDQILGAGRPAAMAQKTSWRRRPDGSGGNQLKWRKAGRVAVAVGMQLPATLMVGGTRSWLFAPV
jgi:hypothetical protein